MIAIDTNILVYSHREDSSFHQAASCCVKELAESEKDWAIPWPCIHEFLAIVTHPRIYKPPTPIEDALIQIDCWKEAPTLNMIGESQSLYWIKLKSLLRKGDISGPVVHDARIAAICLDNGIDILWSADRDYSRFPDLSVKNPLI